jgi:hypothetical protein
MFGFGKKKNDAPESEAPGSAEEGEGRSSNRARVALLGVVLVAALGYLAYEYLPGLLDPAPPPLPVQARPKPAPVAAAAAPAAPAPVQVAAAVPKPEPEAKPAPKPAPEPMAKPEPKPELVAAPKPVVKPEPAAKPEPAMKPEPVMKPEPAAKPEPVAAPASPTPAAELKPAPPAVAPLLGPPPITVKYNDVMTAVVYGDRDAVTQLLDLGRWVDKPDSNGLTPLMAATLARDSAMVQLLLERGADPNLQAPGGDVALEMARTIGDGASESLLLKEGAR